MARPHKTLSHKAKKRWALLVLVLGIPAYIITTVTFLNWLYPDPLNRPSVWVELGIYVGLGMLWAFPLKRIFMGVGQPDPNE